MYPASINATTSYSTDIYRCNKMYFALAVISSCIALVIGVAGALSKNSCQGPDMLGHVASLVRHNPYTPLHPQNGTSDTSELVRGVRQLFLRLEDVGDGTGAVGHIAVSSLHRTSIRQTRAQNPDRSYQ